MINLHRAGNNAWSYTAYRNDFTVWITNRDLADPGAAIDEIAGEILRTIEPDEPKPKPNGKRIKRPSAAHRKPRTR